MINAGMLLASSRRKIFDGPEIRSRVNWKEFVYCQVSRQTHLTSMDPTRRPSVSLSETGIFLWMPSLLISGSLLLSLLCSAWFGLSILLLVEMVDWCASRLVKMICSQIILMASIQVEWWQASLVGLGPLWGHWPIPYVSSFASENCWCSGVVFGRLVHLGCFPAWWKQANVTLIP